MLEPCSALLGLLLAAGPTTLVADEDAFQTSAIHSPLYLGEGGVFRVFRMAAGPMDVTVRMKGACGNCPMSMMTLKQGIEARMKAAIPEVQAVEQI